MIITEKSKDLIAAGVAASVTELCVGRSAAGKVVSDRLETLTDAERIYRHCERQGLSKEGSRFVRSVVRFADWAEQKGYNLPDRGEIGQGGFVRLMHLEIKRIFRQDSLSKQDRSFIAKVDRLLCASKSINAQAVRLRIDVEELMDPASATCRPRDVTDNLLKAGSIELDRQQLNFRTGQLPRYSYLLGDVVRLLNTKLVHEIDSASNHAKMIYYKRLESEYEQLRNSKTDLSWEVFLKSRDPALFLKSALLCPHLAGDEKHLYLTGKRESYDYLGFPDGLLDAIAELPLHSARAIAGDG